MGLSSYFEIFTLKPEIVNTRKNRMTKQKLYRKDIEEIILQDIMILSLFLLKTLYVNLYKMELRW